MDELMAEGMTDEEWANSLLKWAQDDEDRARRARATDSRPEWVAALWLSAAGAWERAAAVHGDGVAHQAAHCRAVGQAILLGR